MPCPMCNMQSQARDVGWSFGTGRKFKYACGTIVDRDGDVIEVGNACVIMMSKKRIQTVRVLK